MNNRIRQLLHAYTSRRSPWGPPWWIYGVAFGVLNLLRQVVVHATNAEVSQPVAIASWVGAALVVIVVINGVAVALHRRGDATQRGPTPTLLPIWPRRRGGERSQQPEHAATDRQPREQATTSTKWAPWWVYLVIIVGANYLRRATVADVGVPAVRVLVALGLAAALFVTITAVYRARVGNRRRVAPGLTRGSLGCEGDALTDVVGGEPSDRG